MPTRRLAAVFPLALLIAACAPKVDIAAEEAALRARSEAVVDAESRMSVEDAVAFYHPDAVVLPAGAPPMRGRDAVRAMYQEVFGSGAIKKFEASITHLEVVPSGDVGIEYGVNRITMAGPAGDVLDVGKYLAVWKKVDGVWYATYLAFSSDAPAPTPAAPAGT